MGTRERRNYGRAPGSVQSDSRDFPRRGVLHILWTMMVYSPIVQFIGCFWPNLGVQGRQFRL